MEMQEDQVNIELNVRKRQSKCHGNRKDQRFRKKYRARGFKPKKIEQLLKRKKQREQTAMEVDTVNERVISDENNDSTNKRKRVSTMPKSTSSISMAETCAKRICTEINNTEMKKNIASIKMNFICMNNKYRTPPYLKRSSSMLFRVLQREFKHYINGRTMKSFVFQRLNLLDIKVYMIADLQFKQSLIQMGNEKKFWPKYVYEWAKTNDFDSCQQYLEVSIRSVQQAMDECQSALNKQIEPKLKTGKVTVEKINAVLEDFVRKERKYLLYRNDQRLKHFKTYVLPDTVNESTTSRLERNKDDLSIDRLIQIRREQVHVWKQLKILELRISEEFLPKTFELLEDFILPMSLKMSTVTDDFIQYKNQQCKIIQDAKRQWLDHFLKAYETVLEHYENQYQMEWNRIETFLSNQTAETKQSTLESIKKDVEKQTNNLRKQTNQELAPIEICFKRNQKRSSQHQSTIGVSPLPYLDISDNPFTKLEWNYLCLGSSFIRQNQSIMQHRKRLELTVKNEHNRIFESVQTFLTEPPHRIPRSNTIFKIYSEQLLEQLNQAYFSPVPFRDQARAYHEAGVVRCIRKKLKQHQLVLRVVDKGGTFYIGDSKKFEEKAQNYFMKTNAFVKLDTNPLHEMVKRIDEKLKDLASKKRILQWQLKKMSIDQKQVRLSHLYFNPKVHKDGIPVRPIQNTINCPTSNISKFLDEHIRPIFDEKCKVTSINNSLDLIRRLDDYTRRNLLKSSTLFCTFDIHNLYTMLPQEESLDILVEFLQVHGIKRIKGIDVETIRELAAIVLKENYFAYDKHIYKQVIGGAMGSSFTLTLANIFMWKWEKELVRQQDVTCELYVRYIDDVFLTWNRSKHQLNTLLNEANRWHPNIKLDFEIGNNLPFLDLMIVNQQGTLLTSNYHKSTIEPYIVPYNSDHPNHIHRNIIREYLTRAIRYSSNADLFNKERRRMKLMLLYNGYPSAFVQKEIETFLSTVTQNERFHIGPIPTEIYASLKNSFSIKRNDTITPTSSDVRGHDNRSIQERNLNIGTMILHHNHEKRLSKLPQRIHDIHQKIFSNTPIQDLKLIIGTRIKRDSRNELIDKLPTLNLLKHRKTIQPIIENTRTT